ncbi:DUF6221 family protein [Streptomyces uncialis]|uniref:DUF6221 family protein n=1 Tax=Streptomyces uncialis TaxID=1048205 RepID=UPI0036678704
MTAALIAFLRARLDEDEAEARGTGMPLDWHQGPGPEDPEWASAEMVLMWPPEHHTPYERDKHWRGRTLDSAGQAGHIARHDPARVLREVEAKRMLIGGITTERHHVTDGDCWYTCAAATEERDGGETCDDNRTGGPCDCGRDERVGRCLRLLALPYADHPDYREEWQP